MQIILALVELDHVVSTYLAFNHTGSGGFGQGFKYSVRAYTDSFYGYFRFRQAFVR